MDCFVELPKIAMEELGMKLSACASYLQGKDGRPNLGGGLRWNVTTVGGLEVIFIHEEDVAVFVQRVINYMNGDA